MVLLMTALIMSGYFVPIEVMDYPYRDDPVYLAYMEGEDSWFANGEFTNGEKWPHSSMNGSWVQYRLALEAVNSCTSPRITEVRIAYSS